MRWSIVRVIWMRELRDQLRDRRTIFMIAVLPVLLYPLAGLGLARWPPASARSRRSSASTASRTSARRAAERRPLLVEGAGRLAASPRRFLDPDRQPKPLEGSAPCRRGLTTPHRPTRPRADGSAALRKPLERSRRRSRRGRPAGLRRGLRDGEQPGPARCWTAKTTTTPAPSDDRFTAVLGRWKKAVKESGCIRHGLPADFDDPFKIDDPERAPAATASAPTTDLFGLLLRVFPFILVMWSLAGALYPAVDLCAGEKERGTMETLLISPASREEIVWGKFLTIWVFSAATALLNLLSMGLTAWNLSSQMPNDAFRPAVLFWSVLLVLPLSAFFSAVCLAVGAYARSSKEGQYYLMPLFLLTLPLIFLTLAPGVELNPFYSMVPVTGVALLLQRLISPDPQPGSPWLYFIPVLAPMVIYSWLALRWAIEQFQREEVLFREAERLDLLPRLAAACSA